MSAFIVNLFGVLLIIGIIWWFWWSKSRVKTTMVSDLVKIKIKDGVYQPAYIPAKANRLITLDFVREDASPCAEVVIFPSLNISQQLPLGKAVGIALTLPIGEYDFTCHMGMYRGKLIVT